MLRVGGLLMRVMAGLLAAGIVAPFVVRLPERFQPAIVVVLTTIACVTAALVVGGRRTSR